jgi:RHS repeat-associated protein
VLSGHHFFDPLRKRIYMGDGTVRSVDPFIKLLDAEGKIREPSTGEASNVYVVASASGEEAYIFDIQTGRHLYTSSTRSGKTLRAFSYLPNGKLEKIVDAFGNETSILRPDANTVQLVAPHGQVSTLKLDANEWLREFTTPALRKYEFTYKDERGLLATFKKPGGAVSTFTYDSRGYLTKDESTSGAFWDLVYTLNDATQARDIMMSTAEGRTYSYLIRPQGATDSSIRTEISPGGATKVVQYFPNQYTFVTEADGLQQTSTHTPDQRFYTQFAFDSITQIYTPSSSLYFNESRSTSFTDTDFLKLDFEQIQTTESANVWTQAFDGASGKYVTTTPEGRSSEITINSFDQVISAKQASFLPVEFSYDVLGRMRMVRQGTRTSQILYNAQGFASEYRNSLNQSTRFDYSADGEILKQTLPDGRFVSFTYDANGNLASVTPPSRPSHNFLYNLFDLVSSYVAPASPAMQYQYNRDKQITQITKADGSTVNFDYMPVSGLLSLISTPDGIYGRNYNSANQLETASGPGGIVLNRINSANLITQDRLETPTFTASLNYSYEKFQPVQVMVAAANTESSVNFEYDRDRLLIGAGSLSINRSPQSGLITGTEMGDLREAFEYDALYGEVSSYRVTYLGNEIYKEIYTRDTLGRITNKAVTMNGVTTSTRYVFDVSGRLTETWVGGALARSYVYDANSNRIQMNDGKDRIRASYDSQDRILSYDLRDYTYNPANERYVRYDERKQKTVEYFYNSLGALAKAVISTKSKGKPAAETFDYINDSLGRRIEIKRNGVSQRRYIYDEFDRLIAELNLNGTIRSHFIYATRSHVPDFLKQNGQTYKLVHDQLGSVRLVVNAANGAIVSKLEYDEFGRLLSSINPDFQPFGFAGGIRDSNTGLVRFMARDYDPETGRWTSKDPILFNGGDANLYGYVMADPVNFIDPIGLWSFSVGGYSPFSGLGGGINFGVNPDGSWFAGVWGGGGIGGGFGFDPDGTSPGYNPSCGPSVSVGAYANAGARWGPFKAGLNAGGGANFPIGPDPIGNSTGYSGPPRFTSGAASGRWGAGFGAGAGLQGTVVW